MDASLFLDNFFSRSRIPLIIQRSNSRSLWSYFGSHTIRNFSDDPALSTRPFQKVQRGAIYFPYEVEKWKVARNGSKIVAHIIKNREISGPYNFWAPAKNIPDVWNWNCWTLFCSETEVGWWPPGPPLATPCSLGLSLSRTNGLHRYKIQFEDLANANIFKQFYCGIAGDPQEKQSTAPNRFIGQTTKNYYAKT